MNQIKARRKSRNRSESRKNSERSKQSPGMDKPLAKPSRAISRKTSLFLHVRAGGRCEFDNCNEYLLEHKPTGTPGYYAEQAHIWAFSERGPRGRAKGRPASIHHIDNLMLLCKACHAKIDNEPTVYTVDVLRKFKRDHEQRIFELTSLAKDRDTVPIVLKAQIANRQMDISDEEMQEAVAPNYLRLRDKVEIDLSSLLDTGDPSYWNTATRVIDCKLDMLDRLAPRDGRALRFSIFGLAPIPLLAYLGFRVSDKMHVDLYQRHRAPESWVWREGEGSTTFSIERVCDGAAGVGLVVNVSGTISTEAIRDVAGDLLLYELAVKEGAASPLVLNTRGDLDRFIRAYVHVLERIRREHPALDCLHLFAAAPAPVAICIGRHVLPKVGPRILLYDRCATTGKFAPALSIGGG